MDGAEYGRRQMHGQGSQRRRSWPDVSKQCRGGGPGKDVGILETGYAISLNVYNIYPNDHAGAEMEHRT